MKVLVKRSSQRHILFWKPVKAKQFYPINYVNVVFCGAVEAVRAKINELLAGQAGQAEFEAFYIRETKTLALWA